MLIVVGISSSLTDDICCLTTHSAAVVNDEELNMSSSNCTKLLEHMPPSGWPSSSFSPVPFITFEDPKNNTV